MSTLSPEAKEAFEDFGYEMLEGRTQGAAAEAFIEGMSKAESLADYLDDWINMAVAEKVKRFIAALAAKQSAGSRVPGAGIADKQVQMTKGLSEPMLAAWGASVSLGLNFVMPDGRKLGDCNRNEVSQAAFKFRTLAKGASNKANWLTLIAQSLPEGMTVRSRLTPQRLGELAREAEKMKDGLSVAA